MAETVSLCSNKGKVASFEDVGGIPVKIARGKEIRCIVEPTQYDGAQIAFLASLSLWVPGLDKSITHHKAIAILRASRNLSEFLISS